MTAPKLREAPCISLQVAMPGKNKQKFDQTTRVMSFEFEDLEKAADKLKLTIDNNDLKNFDNPIFADGNIITAQFGYAGRMAPAREMVITKVTGSTALTVEALAKSVLMNRETKSVTFENIKRSDVIKKLAKDAGYNDDRQDIEDTEIVFPTIVQARMTDAQFIKHLAKKEGFEFYIDFDGFHFHSRKLDQKPIRTLTYFTDPGQGDFNQFNVKNDVTAKPQGVTGQVRGKGIDPKTGKVIDATSNNDKTKREGIADTQKVVDVESGKRTKTTGHSTLRTTSTSNPAAAKRETDAAFTNSQRQTAQLEFTIVGDPDLVAKSIIMVVFPGVKSLTGRYYVTTAKHDVSKEHFATAISCRRDGSSGKSGGGVKNKGAQNTQTPANDKELTAKKHVNTQTGERKTTFHDKKGRK